MVIANVEISDGELAAFCRRWNIRELAVFGSALREDFDAESDLDVLLEFTTDARPTLFDLVHIRDELSELFSRDVDILTRKGIEQSRNPGRRDAILSSAETIYAA